MESNNESAWRQFIALGERIGEGDLGSDEQWMKRDYKRLSKILIPQLREQDKEKRKQKATMINTAMQNLMAVNKCKCGGNLQQKRSGTKVCYCTDCGARYVARK